MAKKSIASVFAVMCFSITFLAFFPTAALAQADSILGQRIKKIMERPEFAHSRFGIQFYSLDAGKIIYELNSQQLFVPGSTAKLFTEGTALELLGADHRFHTRIYRTGPIERDGTLNGDLVLVAGGDPNLSNPLCLGGSVRERSSIAGRLRQEDPEDSAERA